MRGCPFKSADALKAVETAPEREVAPCGVCKVKMTSGEVEMAVEDALDPDDKANGIIVACQAKPTEDVMAEA